LQEECAMSAKSPPAGYHTVTPSLIVRDAAQAIEFYKRAFGAEEVTRMPGPGGSIMHAEIRIGDSVVMLGEENAQWGTLSPLSTKGNPGSLHLYVDDADAAFARALAAGATTRYPLEDVFWGDRYGKVTDPFGHEWGIATHVRDVSPEEMQQAAAAWMAQQGSGAAAGAQA
jgi:PhnB protein